MKENRIEIHTIKTEYHADDYALFPAQSDRILDCCVNGNLNGVSVMANSNCLDQCMAQLSQMPREVAVSVHLNLIEGASLCGREEVPLLTDGQGNLCCSYGRLLMHSFLPDRNVYKQQLKREFSAQIQAVSDCLPDEIPLRIDSHAHYHMIPVAFDALMEVIEEEQISVSYIRIPREYISLYLPHLFRLKDFSCINIVKVLLLNLLSAIAAAKHGTYLEKLEKKIFLGVFLSGRMHRENVSLIMPGAMALAQKKGWDLELLSHPGGVFEEEDIARITSPDDVAFLTSSMRNVEKTMFQNPDYYMVQDSAKQKL